MLEIIEQLGDKIQLQSSDLLLFRNKTTKVTAQTHNRAKWSNLRHHRKYERRAATRRTRDAAI